MPSQRQRACMPESTRTIKVPSHDTNYRKLFSRRLSFAMGMFVRARPRRRYTITDWGVLWDCRSSSNAEYAVWPPWSAVHDLVRSVRDRRAASAHNNGQCNVTRECVVQLSLPSLRSFRPTLGPTTRRGSRGSCSLALTRRVPGPAPKSDHRIM